MPRGRLVKEGEVERAVALAAMHAAPDGAVLVLVDADTDCPAQIGPTLLARAQAAVRDCPLAVVLAKYEFENWFLAAAESIRGHRGLSDDLMRPTDPESIEGAKGWLRHHMPRNRTYSETADQPALTAVFDLAAARSVASFDKCWRDIAELVHTICPR